MKSRVSFIALAALCGLLGPYTAQAEDDGALDEVVVSATRRAAATSEISAAISVVDANRARTQKLVTDALASSPGVFLQQTTPGQGAAIIRGLKGSSILHLVDGVRLNNAIFRSAPTQYLALVPVTAVERIEALRGTPTSLYGSDAVGGIVNIVTRLPQFDTDDSTVRGDLYAAYETADLGKTLRGVLDIGNRNVATSLSLENVQTGNRQTGSGARIAPSGYESTAGRYVMSITPADGRVLLFDAQYLEQPDTPRVDELVPGFGQTEPSSSEFFFRPNRRIFAHARYDHSEGPFDLDWRVDLSWQRVDDDRVTRDFQSALRRFEQNRSDLSGIVLTASRPTSLGSWVAGIEAYHDRVTSRRQQEDLVSGLRVDVASRFPDRATLDRAAVFFNTDAAVTNRHTLSGGIRLSSERVELPQTVVTNAADLDVTDVSGDIGWRYAANDNWQLVANLGYGFRAPNVFDLGTLGERPGNRFNIPNTSLDSEHVLHFDVGARRRGDDWQLDVTLFALDYDDRITSVSTGDTTTNGRVIVQSVNAADSRIYGAELGATLSLAADLQLRAVLNYTHGEQELGGIDEPSDRIPPLSGRFMLEYDSGESFSASAWIGFADAQDRLSERDMSDVRIDPNGTPGWAILGTQIEWRPLQGWEFTFGLDNLLDQRYRRHGSGIDSTGRSLSVSIRFAW